MPRHATNPNLKQRPQRALFCLKLDNYCCYARYSCGNKCNVVVKLVQECKFFLTHFTSVLRKQFAANDTFLREANGYKRALALRNSRQMHCTAEIGNQWCGNKIEVNECLKISLLYSSKNYLTFVRIYWRC